MSINEHTSKGNTKETQHTCKYLEWCFQSMTRPSVLVVSDMICCLEMAAAPKEQPVSEHDVEDVLQGWSSSWTLWLFLWCCKSHVTARDRHSQAINWCYLNNWADSWLANEAGLWIVKWPDRWLPELVGEVKVQEMVIRLIPADGHKGGRLCEDP